MSKYTISTQLYELFKNFAAINQSLKILQGNKITTKDVDGNLMALTRLDDEFPIDLGIYNLNEFISILNLVGTTDVVLKDKYMNIRGDKSSVKYFYSHPDAINAPLDAPQIDDFVSSFVLTLGDIIALKKAASALDHDRVTITGEDDKVVAKIWDPHNKTASSFEIELAPEFEGDDFQFSLNINTIAKFIGGDYTIEFCDRDITKCTYIGNEYELEYWCPTLVE